MLITEPLFIQPKQESKFVKSAVKVFEYLGVKMMDFRRISFYPPANPAKIMNKIEGYSGGSKNENTNHRDKKSVNMRFSKFDIVKRPRLYVHQLVCQISKYYELAM